MKKFTFILCNLLALSLLPVWGQQTPMPPFSQRMQEILRQTSGSPDQPKLTTFNLDFPGGWPAQLVEAIEKATKKPLNVIILPDDANTQLPPLKMNDVNVAQLFQALERVSVKNVSIRYGNSYSMYESYYSFRTEANSPTDSSIWYFHVEKPNAPPPDIAPPEVCRFYQLQPYLNHGFTVDDITTAIQTGWKMAGITAPPELNYHKETSLLIACGKQDDLATIQNVLQTLPETYIDKSRLDHLYLEVEDLKSQIRQLSDKASDLTTNSSASTEKNSGK